MPAAGSQRIDKWLFFARVVKSRSLAQGLIAGGKVRVNREKTTHAAHVVRPGDVLTVSVANAVRVLKVVAPGERRGPAPEAAELYEDLTPPPEVAAPKSMSPTAAAPGFSPSERPPTKRERRAMDRLRWSDTDEHLN